MIRTKDIAFKVGEKTLLHPLSLELEQGKLHLILGPNGAGKSTLVKLLSALVRPSGGSIFYGERAVDTYKIDELAKFRAVLSQSIDMAFPISVAEVVMMGRYPHFLTKPTKNDRDIAGLAMQNFGISALAGRDYTTLSGGEKQRVQFARVMAQIWPVKDGQRYLFLDEPLTYLDTKYQYDFLRMIRMALQGQELTVVGVLHDLNLAARFADNLILLDSGKLVTKGSAREVLTVPHIEAVYGMKPELLHHNGRILIDFG